MLGNSEKGKCFICGKCGYTEKHHVFGGPCRKNSEKDGLTVYLCKDHHTGAHGVHTAAGKEYMKFLHEEGQKQFEAEMVKEGMEPDEAREYFIRRYIRSYL